MSHPRDRSTIRHDPPVGPFRYSHTVEVRFRDTDAMGHANNAVYLTYFEIARAGYYRAVTGHTFESPAETSTSIILAHARVEFRSPAWYGEVLLVECRTAWAGRSSFALEYRITTSESERGAGRVVADGETIQVAYDYASARPVRLPADMLARLAAYEGYEIPPRPTAAGVAVGRS